MTVSGHSVTTDQAIRLLQDGRIVALPTETVYGLAADATNATAIAKIYAAKARPHFNPLICHVAHLDAARNLGVFNASAMHLATVFWPGPLTLVVPRHADCPVDPLASAGLNSLAVRVPDHPQIHPILATFPFGVVAPSANKSGKLSPVLPAHVWASLGPTTPVLEGGQCAAGLESTIIACLDNAAPVILREGAISREDIEEILGKKLHPHTAPRAGLGGDVGANPAAAHLSPGQLLKHYAPKAQLRLNADFAEPDEVLLGFGAGHANPYSSAWNLSAQGDLIEAAANLFAMLHDMDAQGITKIAISPIPDVGVGRAINDRLRRAKR